MSAAPAAEHRHPGPVAWPPDAHYGTATPGKIGMWIFLVSDAFSFAALLIAYGSLRTGAAVWRQAGEPELGVGFPALLTLLLVLTSVSIVLAYAAAAEGRRQEGALLLGLTALGGALFLVGQAQEWFGLFGPGLLRQGLVFGRSARASIFYVTSGFHALHVLAGIVYILAVLVQYRRGRVGAPQIELLGLFWCFIAIAGSFVFSFLYLMP